ncbi:MAG: glycosyltransferase family 4 protein [Bacteroidales bacterium]|nr:glycosyltransferase family 4 protein [Bacteroidales bacterium]
MKVLFVCSNNLINDINPIIKSQGQSLIKQGIDVKYYSIVGKGLKGYLKNIIPLKKEINKNNYDLIHAHYALSAWVARLTFTRLPIVVSFMGCDTYGDVDENGKKILKSYFEIIIAKLLQAFIAKIIVKSKNLEKYIYLKKKCEIIPNGVDFDRFNNFPQKKFRKDLNLKQDKKYILFLGNKNDKRKNFSLAKQALKKINSSDIDLISPYLVTHNEIPKYLNAVDVLLLTSFLEGSPNVIKEAMACNLPIVSTDVGDVKEIISDTDGCFLTGFDVNDVVKKLLQALDYNGRTNGRKNIQFLNENIIAEKLINVYKSLVNY